MSFCFCAKTVEKTWYFKYNVFNKICALRKKEQQ